MRQLEFRSIVDRVIHYTISNPAERLTWEKAPAISGVLAWDNEQARSAVRNWLDRAVEAQTSEGSLNYSDREEYAHGHVRSLTPTPTLAASLGFPLLAVYRETKDEAYLDAAKRQAQAVLNTPRTKDGGFWARKEAPELWIDFVYMMCPFLARLGKLTGDTSLVDEAYRQLDVHVKHLVDADEYLARHAWCEMPNSYPQSTFWARGNGWLVCCIMDLLDEAPDHARSGAARELVKKVLSAIHARQDRSGYLRHILDDADAKFEASSTLMFAYASRRAAEHKIVGADMIEAALRAFKVVAGSIGDDGAVRGVAVPPGGPGVMFGTTLFGQGFFLLAAHALRQELKLSKRG